MKITFQKRKSKKLSEFLKKEWKLVHPEHFGEEYDGAYWQNKYVKIKAVEDREILGALSGHFMAGVFYISEVMVAHNKRGLGVGNKLMQAAENFAKENRGHMLYLETGSDWRAVKFYEKIGFRKITLLKNFYNKKDFWLMAKYLE